MKAAKIISFISFIYNSCSSVYFLKFHFKLLPTFQELQMTTPLPWPFIFALMFAIVSLGYWFYLKNKEKKGENVRFVLWVSIALLLIPQFLIVLISAFIYLQPMYDILGAT